MTNPTWANWPRHPAESCGTYKLSEADRIKSDLQRNQDKNTGALQRREVDRAHAEEVKAGVVS